MGLHMKDGTYHIDEMHSLALVFTVSLLIERK